MALHEPHLPQRLRAVEALGEDPGGQPQQLLLVSRRRQRGLADVIGEVEVGVVHPQRPAGAQGRITDLLAIARNEVEPPADVLEEVLVGRWRPLERGDATDVHMGPAALLEEEGGVHGAEAIEVLLGHRNDPTPGIAVDYADRSA